MLRSPSWSSRSPHRVSRAERLYEGIIVYTKGRAPPRARRRALLHLRLREACHRRLRAFVRASRAVVARSPDEALTAATRHGGGRGWSAESRRSFARAAGKCSLTTPRPYGSTASSGSGVGDDELRRLACRAYLCSTRAGGASSIWLKRSHVSRLGPIDERRATERVERASHDLERNVPSLYVFWRPDHGHFGHSEREKARNIFLIVTGCRPATPATGLFPVAGRCAT